MTGAGDHGDFLLQWPGHHGYPSSLAKANLDIKKFATTRVTSQRERQNERRQYVGKRETARHQWARGFYFNSSKVPRYFSIASSYSINQP